VPCHGRIETSPGFFDQMALAFGGHADLIEAQLIQELEEEIASLIKQHKNSQASLRWWEALNLPTVLSSERSRSQALEQIKRLLDGVELAPMLCASSAAS